MSVSTKMFYVIVIYMITLTSSGLLGESATESHTSISITTLYNECYNVCSENGTIYCALQANRCTYVRSSVDQRDSATLTCTQMRQSVITGIFQATQRCRMKTIIVGNYFHRWEWHYPCHFVSWFAACQNRKKSTAPPQSSELTLTRVMSPKGSCPNNAKVMNQINDHSCSICTQSMGNKFWVCCRCYAYGHPRCIQITVVERRQSLLMGQLHYFVELERERRPPHQQVNRFSKQWLRHGRPVSQRTIAPRQRRRSCYLFLLFQTHQQIVTWKETSSINWKVGFEELTVNRPYNGTLTI